MAFILKDLFRLSLALCGPFALSTLFMLLSSLIRVCLCFYIRNYVFVFALTRFLMSSKISKIKGLLSTPNEFYLEHGSSVLKLDSLSNQHSGEDSVNY